MVALIAQPSMVGDSNWYPNSGATHYLTNDMQNMAVRGEYMGNDQIHIGNGTGLTISHFGNAILPTISRPLHLSNVLLVPKITKNLLSVANFTSDNDVIFEFHPRFCLMKDRATGKVPLRGTLEHGLYCLLATQLLDQPSFSNKSQGFHVSKPSFDLWHSRLGHSSLRVVNGIIRSRSLPVKLSP
ncbi:hypothetical protein FXO38_03144 [Capsicum annuum]|uniref:Retrovirus-related Pol polyprotein from transposon TNT 1-94-like beta-barrel domain-containing protein n=1 Tax=Capsicum annuum TaxID=4072 RepID=A0A2G2YNJ0_CAPAN|nr:hypothetical protein FXO37_33997 [Capsicum annuum]KAF3678645.1 hypothetical protein FXO38_03144 [Capsicum annuum]PHT71306.1 hypothetical protein T459_26410 [Capsicum annuum]